MNNVELMYAALLALTRQNVIRSDAGGAGAIVGDAVLFANGWVINAQAIIGNLFPELGESE